TAQHRICQCFLGQKDHIERRGSDLVPALRQTVGPLFSALEPDFPFWSAATGSQPLLTIGPDHEVLLDLIRVNRKRLREMFAAGVAELATVFQSILSPDTLAELQRVALLGENGLRVCRFLSQIRHQPRPHHSSLSAAFPRTRTGIPHGAA